MTAARAAKDTPHTDPASCGYRDEEYVGLVADDVDRIQGKLVKQTATVNCHVPSARRELAAVAAAMDEPAPRAALPSAKGAGR